MVSRLHVVAFTFFRMGFLTGLAGLAPAQTWTVETLPNPRFRMAATAVGDEVFFAGGADLATTPSAIVDVYNETTGMWSSLTLPNAMDNGSAIGLGTNAYFVPGLTPAGVVAEVYVYDTTVGTFSTIALNSARLECNPVAVGDSILLAGGFDVVIGPLYYNPDVEIIDTTTGTSLTVPINHPTFASLSKMSSTSVGGLAFFSGGHGPPGPGVVFNSQILSVDPTSMVGGVVVGALSTPRWGVAAESIGTRAYFIGGGDITGNMSDAVDVYNVATNEMTTLTLPAPVFGAASAVLGSEIILAGGITDSVFTIQVPSGVMTQAALPNGAPARFGLASTETENAAYFAGGADVPFTTLFDDVFILGAPPSPFTSLCSGTGESLIGCDSCPCGNNGPLGSGGGCMNSSGNSATLTATGIVSAAADTMRYEVTGANPNTFGIL
ncbi:MAG: hypothetical protein AAF368_04560, partial [Planctomycetota bacterium]